MKMSKAEKMFNELGFVRQTNSRSEIVYQDTTKGYWDYVFFYKEVKTYEVYRALFGQNPKTSRIINVELHQAITVQMKELE